MRAALWRCIRGLSLEQTRVCGAGAQGRPVRYVNQISMDCSLSHIWPRQALLKLYEDEDLVDKLISDKAYMEYNEWVR